MPASPTFITEPSRRVEVIHETDVLVVGSGPGGLAAAIAAARAGVDVTLVERFGCWRLLITVVVSKVSPGIAISKPSAAAVWP
jgi:2-polyprenyl-6-methoxyphenol hydroxylase-like FAD-dependent oxidoreductase